jgi:hypothetical protein
VDLGEDGACEFEPGAGGGYASNAAENDKRSTESPISESVSSGTGIADAMRRSSSPLISYVIITDGRGMPGAATRGPFRRASTGSDLPGEAGKGVCNAARETPPDVCV